MESFPTGQDFYDAHGVDYVNNVVLPKEATDWVATYSGGFDYDTGALSSSDNAFEVIWFPYGARGHREVEARMSDVISGQYGISRT